MESIKSKRILLIRSFYTLLKQELAIDVNEPLGLEYLAAMLKNNGYNVKILDCLVENWKKFSKIDNMYHLGITEDQVKEKISKLNPNVVAVTSQFSSQHENANKIINIAKEIDKNIVTIIGGSHPSTSPIKTIKENPNIDFLVYGEGELTFVDLLDHLDNPEKVEGIVYRKNKKIKKNKPRPLIKDIDSIPFPDRDLVPLKEYSNFFLPKLRKYFLNKPLADWPIIPKLYYYYGKFNEIFRNKKPRLPVSSIISSRGCPNDCYFCAIHKVWGNTYRMRSAKNVLEELTILSKKYGVKEIFIEDDNFTVSKKRTIEICKGVIERKLDLTFNARSGIYPNTMDKEVLYWMKKAGFYRLMFGIESGSQRVLSKVIHKRIDLINVRKIIKLANNMGFITGGWFILGMPGESINDMKETIKFASTSNLKYKRYHICQPLPGTKVFEISKKNNYISKNLKLSQLRMRPDKPIIKTEQFTPEDVIEMKKLSDKI